MASSQEKPGLDSSVKPLANPDRPEAIASSYNTKIHLKLIGALLERDFVEMEVDGKMFYVFDGGVERGRRQAIILHREDYLSDINYRSQYPEILKQVLPTESESKVHIVPQRIIDYLLKEKRKKEHANKSL